MARKRLTANAIEKLEMQIVEAGKVAESAVFGICDMERNVIKRLMMTAKGVQDVTNVVDTCDHLIPAKLERLLYPKPWKVAFGGRGSGKTRTVTSVLTESARFRPERIACFREIQASIDDSSYQELVDEIGRKGEAEEFRCIDGKITHKGTKSKFRFRGLYRNVSAVKGFAGITKAWVEEAENVSQSSWDMLEPTIRNPGSEIWITFNPNKRTDPTWTQWVEPYCDKMVDGIYEDDEILVIECNWQDNPWMTEELIRSKDKMKRTDIDRYNWIWEGRFNARSDEMVFGGKYVVEDFAIGDSWHGPYLGMDFGFSVDPTAMVSVYISDNEDGTQDLWIDHEHGGVNMEVTDTPAQMEKIPKAKTTRWHADCARPETISHIKRQGYDIYSCNKWAGSVEDGIAHMRGYSLIHIHTRCIEVAREFAMYSYKVDKLTGNVLTDVVDKFNHYIDAIRYALNDMISQKGGAGILLRKRRR